MNLQRPGAGVLVAGPGHQITVRPRYQARRYAYLENALISREMDRL